MKLRPLFHLLPLAVFLCGGCRESAGADRPNVVVLLFDTLRRDRLECMSGREGLSPAMDRIAKEGVIFSHALSASSWTKPSVASFMTGVYPGRHGTVLSPDRPDVVNYTGIAHLNPDYVTLSERLQAAGYLTGAFVTNPHIIPTFSFDRGFDDFVQPAGDAEELLEKALAWIEAAEEKDRPYFLYLHLIDVHEPYRPPERYWDEERIAALGSEAPFIKMGNPSPIRLWADQYKTWKASGREGPFRFDYEGATPSIESVYPEFTGRIDIEKFRNRMFLDFAGFEDEELLKRKEFLISRYESEVEYCNDSMTSFLDALEKRGSLGKMVMVITADHGEAFLEHEDWGHGFSVHGEEIDIPLIFRVPHRGGTYTGAYSCPVSLVDVYPTILDLVGLSVPRYVDGRSLKPLILGREGDLFLERPVFAEAILPHGDFVTAMIGKKKLVRARYPDRSIEWSFYDLDLDPEERAPGNGTGTDEAARVLRRSIEGLLEQRTLDFEGMAKEYRLTPEELQQMKALGY